MRIPIFLFGSHAFERFFGEVFERWHRRFDGEIPKIPIVIFQINTLKFVSGFVVINAVVVTCFVLFPVLLLIMLLHVL